MLRKLLLTSLILLLSVGVLAEAKVVREEITYSLNARDYTGTFYYDDATENKRPAVLIFHDWRGPGPREAELADYYARRGQVCFVADVYGKEFQPETTEQATALSRMLYEDRDLLRSRAQAAYNAMAEKWIVDESRVAALGISFGGTCALELGRNGAKLAGIVAYHAPLTTPDPEDGGNIRGRVLVFHADNDRFMHPDALHRFIDEMRKGKVPYELVVYGDAYRGFMDPTAGNNPLNGVKYDEELARRATETTAELFKVIFKSDNSDIEE